MSTSISEAVEILKQKAREDAKLFFEEFGEVLDPAGTDWDSVAFQTSFNELAFKTKDALEGCSDFRPFIHVEEALERGEFSDCGWEIYQSELVAETKRLAGLE
jgi:hypothetical protein